MDPNYANAGGGGGVGVGVGIGIVPSAATGGVVGSGTTVPTASAIPSGRYNTAFYKDSLAASCQRGAVVPPPYNTYDPYGSSGKVSSAYPYDAEAEFKERTGMGKTTTKVMAGNVVIPSNSAKVQHQQHAYSQNSCYSGSYSQSNAPESANYYAAALAYEQQQQQQHHHYTQQQQQQYHHHQHHHHQSQLQQQYKYNKLVAAQQQQHQQQQHHQHSQQQKIPPPEYGYASYHHPYYHPHYHHPSSSSSSSAQKGVTMMKTIPDAGSSSSSMPYGSSSSKMMTARAPQYPTNYNAFHHHPPQSSYPPVVTAGHQHQHQHTYQSQSVCEDSSRWMWNSSSNSSGNEYPNSSSCRSGGTYSAYVNGTSTAAVAAAAAAKQHNTMWPSSHSMPMQYQTTGYPAAAAAAGAMASNQSCCPPPPPHHPSQSSTTTFYPQQYVKYPIHQNAVDYNNDLYGNSPQSNPSSTTAGGVVAGVTASGKVYTDLSGNSYQQAINNNPVAAFHHHHHQQQQQQTGEYSLSHSSTVDYNSPRYLQQQHHHHHHQQQQQQHQTESPSSLSSGSSSTSSYNHHYYHPYSGYSNAAEAAAHQESYQQQVDTKIKSQSLRDFLTSWNEDEDEMNAATEVPFMEQMHLNSDHFAQDNNGGAPPPVMENHLQFKGSFSSTSRPKIHVGITVDSTVESDQYINLPDIIIDIEKSNKDIVSLNDDCHVANIPSTMTTKLEKDDVLIKEEMPNVKENDGEENIEEEAEKYPKKQRNQSIQREKKSISSSSLSVSSMRRKCQNSKRFRTTKQRFTVRRHHRKLKIVRRKFIRRRVKKQPKQPTFNNTSGSNNILQQYNPQSLKCLCVSLINSEKFRKRVLGPRSDIVNLFNNNKNTNNNSNIITTVVDNEVNVPLLSSTSDSNCTTSNSSSTSVIPKLSDLCKNALNSSFDRDVLVINLDEILDSDNLFVVQCDINENILENFVDESVQLQQQQEEEQQQEQENSSSSNNSNKIINVNDDDREEEAEDLVEILNDNNNNYNNNNNSGSSSENNNQDIQFTPISNDIEQQHLKRRRCCSRSRSHSPTTEVSNLPLDNSVEHNNNFNLSSINPLIQPPLPSSPPPPSLLTPPPLPSSPPPPSPPLSPLEVTAAADGSISCPTAAKATKLLYDDGRGHDRHSHSSSSSLIEQNFLACNGYIEL
ncbi:putative uncharacterized protein DDB_G0277255 [Episyrphus balteatus]|uniref:putative uncharacterized protein DDB_G0277255 n=1 Tax=Episyrphus balteatus TaxID=286459 RepID=UPI002486B98F|nr:putative uncharacterized protein DDB_G0277255 [Episyrphus balteatus]